MLLFLFTMNYFERQEGYSWGIRCVFRFWMKQDMSFVSEWKKKKRKGKVGFWMWFSYLNKSKRREMSTLGTKMSIAHSQFKFVKRMGIVWEKDMPYIFCFWMKLNGG